MRILFVASRVPAPPLQGDRLRAFHQLRLFGRRHQIILVAPVRSRADWTGLQAVAPFCERVEAVPLLPWPTIGSLARGFWTGLPWQSLLSCPPAVTARVEALAEEAMVDLVHVQLVRMAPAVEGLTGPRVFDLIDALSLSFERRASLTRGLRAWVIKREAARLRRAEQALLGTGAPLVVASPVDRAALGPQVHVVPNGVDLQAFPFLENGRDDPTLVFSGRMRYLPNADAACFFAREVFPLVRREIPDARCLLVGADPPRRVRRLQRLPGVAVVGFVPSMAEVLHRAALAVCPLRAATGIQNKVLEAMATGTPVVATPQALGGIPEAQNLETCLVGDGPDELASACVRLLRDRPLARRLARAARALVEARYTWARSVGLLEAVYQEAVEKNLCAVS